MMLQLDSSILIGFYCKMLKAKRVEDSLGPGQSCAILELV